MSFEAQVMSQLIDIAGNIGEMKSKIDAAYNSAEENKEKLSSLHKSFDDINLKLSRVPYDKHIIHHDWVSAKMEIDVAKKNALLSWKNLVAKEGITKAMMIMVPATLVALGSVLSGLWAKIIAFFASTAN